MTNATQGRRPTGPGAYRYIIDGHDVCDCLVTMHHDQRRLVCMWVGAWNGGKRFDRWEFVDEMPGDFIALSPPVAAPEPETPYSSPYSTALPDRTGYWYRLYVESTTGNWIDVVESVTVVDCVDGSKKAMLEWRDSVGNLKFTELVESYDCWWAEVVMPPWPIAEMD